MTTATIAAARAVAACALAGLAACASAPRTAAPVTTGAPSTTPPAPPATQQPAQPAPPGATSPVIAAAPGAVRIVFAPGALEAVPGWDTLDKAPARRAFVRSCALLAGRADGARLGPAYAGTAGQWREACRKATDTRLPDAAFFSETFDAWRVSASDGSETGRLTAYYEPTIDVSPMATDATPEPLLPRPADLVSIRLEEFDPALAGRTIVGRIEGGTLRPYPIRSDITRAAQEALAWGDRTDVAILQIQGSGRLRFPDGRKVRAGFAAHNGRPFRSLGGELIARGELTRENASMDAIKRWMKAAPAPDQMAVMNANPRYVFFQTSPIADPAVGPTGSQGLPLEPLGSAAIDPAYHPFGAPILIDAEAPVLAVDDVQRRILGLVIGQDSGGAILGPMRADYFIGSGEEAGLTAGRVNHFARWHVLLPKGVDPRSPEP
jgi:membrane-bound lytic murein transglycosylase A